VATTYVMFGCARFCKIVLVCNQQSLVRADVRSKSFMSSSNHQVVHCWHYTAASHIRAQILHCTSGYFPYPWI
jgi:hypothetical protein